MLLYWSLDDVPLRDVWLTIGTFDGVHRGHRTIIRTLVDGAIAANRPSVVLTFHPHPAIILGNRQGPFYLTSPEERAVLLADLGVDAIIIHPFDRQVVNIQAREFVSRLHRQMRLRHLLVGHDFALGRGREGNALFLQRLGQECGYTLEVMPSVQDGDQVVSSSRIRLVLAEGKVEQAGDLLGRPYQVSGKVVHGDGRGRTIGIPTANLEIWTEKVLPRSGVYATLARIRDETWPSVTNVGFRPTFENQPAVPQVETHVLNFDRDLYDQAISLSFIARLRDEQRFPNIEALVLQIQQDILRARLLLK